MIALLSLPTKSTFSFFRLVCCGRFRQSKSRSIKAGNAVAGFFGYFFFLKKNSAALLSALKNNKEKAKKSKSRGRRQEKIIHKPEFGLDSKALKCQWQAVKGAVNSIECRVRHAHVSIIPCNA